MEDIKKVLLEAAHEAGALMLERFQGRFEIEHKEGINNLVTEVDTACEAIIINKIKHHFPDHSILSEEDGATANTSTFQWIIDPIDGTVNFAHGVPLCCISIAVKKDAAIVLGAIYNPMMDEFFFAEAGKGAFLNGEPISVSSKTDFNTAFLVTGFPYHYDEQTDPLRVFSKLIKRGLPIRRLGSAALDLCWVACGRFDAFWEYYLNPWDSAAGLLLVREAGGVVTNFKGEQHIIFEPEMLASNGHIHADLLNELNT